MTCSDTPTDAITARAATPDDAAQATPRAATELSRPRKVLFTRRAYTAILSEVLKKAPAETGGILLGYRDTPEWVVVESLDPGPNAIHQAAYFEYDHHYVNHLVNRVRAYYDRPLDLLGLWHRHPGSFDRFSGTDDGTNHSFARMSPTGAISGLVNVDPRARLTLFHVSAEPFRYVRVPFDVLDVNQSIQRAPLRDIAELASALEQGCDRELPNADDVSTVPESSGLTPSLAAKRIGDTIRRSKHAITVSARSLARWSDELMADALADLEADLQFFESRGITLSMRCPDEHRLELFATQGQGELTICQLVVLRTTDDSAETRPPMGGLRRLFQHRDQAHVTCCVMGASDARTAVAYTPNYLQRCIDHTH